MKIKTKKFIIYLVFFVFLAACSFNNTPEKEIEDDIFITSILDQSTLAFSEGGAGNNSIPFLIISTNEINDLNLVLKNDNNQYTLSYEIQEINLDDLPISTSYIYSKYDYNIKVIEQLVKEQEEDFNIDQGTELDKLMAISDEIKQESLDKLRNQHIYRIYAYFDFNTIHYPSVYDTLVISKKGEILEEKSISVTFNAIEDPKVVSRISASWIGYEVQFGSTVRFDYSNTYQILNDTILKSYKIKDKNLDVEALYIRHKSNNQIQTYNLDKQSLSDLSLTLKSGDLLIIVPTITTHDNSSLNKPFYYGALLLSLN